MLIENINLARLMIYVQQFEEDNIKDREVFKYKRVKHQATS